MGQMLERGERLVDHGVMRAAMEVRDHGDPARVVLESGVVKTRR